MKDKEQSLKRFGVHFRTLRKSLGLSQDAVVINSDRLVKSTVSDVENGKRNFEFTTLLDLEKDIRKPPKDLLDYDHTCDE